MTNTMNDTDLFDQMRRRGAWLLRLHVRSGDIDAAEFHYVDGPSTVIHIDHDHGNEDDELDVRHFEPVGLAETLDDDDPVLVELDWVAWTRLDGRDGEVTVNADLELMTVGGPASIPPATGTPCRFTSATP